VVSTGVEVRNAITVHQRQSGEQGSQRKILLAEDSPVYRHLISGHPKEWGFDLQIAKDGAAPWELLQASYAPRLALLDWALPKIDGVELCRRPRASETVNLFRH
jgi:DNA-binding response OmpR family regulator